MTDAALPGSMFLKTKASRAANQLSNIGKRATNASAIVAIGTTASNVVNERLLAVRARPMSRIRMATRQTKRNGFKAGWAGTRRRERPCRLRRSLASLKIIAECRSLPLQRKLTDRMRDSFVCHNGDT